jgi:hypothetical protein
LLLLLWSSLLLLLFFSKTALHWAARNNNQQGCPEKNWPGKDFILHLRHFAILWSIFQLFPYCNKLEGLSLPVTSILVLIFAVKASASVRLLALPANIRLGLKWKISPLEYSNNYSSKVFQYRSQGCALPNFSWS